jgi:preprotein translocase SecF subunit
MMLLKLVPDKTNIKFMSFKRFASVISIVWLIGSVISLFVFGLNFGIDFKGGTLLEIRTEQPLEVGEVRSTLNALDIGAVSVQEFGDPRDLLIRLSTDENADSQMGIIDVASSALKDKFDTLEVRRIEVVGPKVSGELFQEGMIALGLALLAILIYIWLRFEWQFAVAAIAALFHDLLLTAGLFSIFQLEFNLSIIAALLTIVGYSLNDTVIVFDRVRENLRRYKVTPLPDVLDQSLNETLSRTAMTSLTTLMALGILYILGGEAVSGFTLAMIWGIFVGTHSSIFIACPLLLAIGIDRNAMTLETSESSVNADA